MGFLDYALAFVCALLFSVILCAFLIPVLRKVRAGQNVLRFVEEHKTKGGTPTMGGIAFLSSAVIVFLFCCPKIDRTIIVTLVVGIAYGLVGLLDDFLKIKRKDNLGLTAKQKIVFQIVVALLAAVYAWRAGLTKISLPFLNSALDIGWGIIPVSAFVFLATVNCVNLTDGLDGLAAGTSTPFFLFFAVLLAGKFDGLSVLSVSLAGALTGYLLFNSPPASVFMGDTGSLALGGFASCIGVFSGSFLYIAIVGVAFVLSGVSVIAQVLYFKATGGKRIFKMAPLHHHFQRLGYDESKISYGYFVLTLTVAIFCLIFNL
jgi:phospho-N-acetylmuramoyl-pentapeptide-transferase